MDRILPPQPPRSSPSLLKTSSGESDFWADLFVDLSVRVEWLGQALDAVPKEDASASALVRLRGYARALADLAHAIERVQAHRADPLLKPLFSLEGPLAGYLSRLYGWCDEIGTDFERMAVALRRRQPTSMVFSHKSVNASYAQFDELTAVLRHTNDVARDLHGAKNPGAWRMFEEHLEELIWAGDWVHMALARRPGD